MKPKFFIVWRMMPLIQIEQKVAEIDKNSMKQENEGKRTLNFYIF